MNRPRAVFACIALALSIAHGWGQEVRSGAGRGGAKELKRTAHLLHIPAEQLKNARTVLREATELAGALDPIPLDALPQIADSWILLNRSQAPSAIASLYTRLSASASMAPDVQTYREATFAAQGLLTPLADLDSGQALELIRQWPYPQAALGEEAAKLRDQLELQFQNQVAQRMTYRDPDAAQQLLLPFDPSRAPDYSIRGQVALQLARSGETEQAGKIADQVVADFRQRDPDSRNVQEYASFLLSLSMQDSDRFRSAFAVLSPLLSQSTLESGTSSTVQVGDKTLELSPTEFSILNVFRGLQLRPELAVSTLDALPGLKAKLESIGGLDNFLNPIAAADPVSVMDATPGGVEATDGRQASGRHKDTESSLYAELRGKLSKNPGKVRARLSGVASDPARFYLLTGLAQRAAYDDPDLSSLALEVAAAHLDQVDPLQRRVSALESLVGTYRQCQGEVDSELIRSGFVIADRLRQEEANVNPDASGDRPQASTMADQLEATLVSEYARDNFDAAMRFLNSKPDDGIKMMLLLRTLQGLRSGN